MTTSFVRTASVIVVIAMSCSKSKRSTSSELGGAADAGARGVQVGDRVVVENTTASFVEGTVVAVVRDRARVQLGSTGEIVEQSLSEVYVPSPTDAVPSTPAIAQAALHDAKALLESTPLREGSFAVCHMPDARWRGCRIEAVGTAASVVDDEANAAELAWHEVLAATPVTMLNVRQRFDRSAKRRAFREGARSAGRPRVPSHWRPSANERVLAERDGAWMVAQIKSMKKNSVRLQWDSDRRLADVMLSDLCPEPPIDFAPTVGTYVLARPTDGARAWSVMRVESAGASNLVLSDELGDHHERAMRDVVPLERR
jgi:hypothetical protein